MGRQAVAVPDDLSTEEKVAAFLGRLVPASRGEKTPAAALVPWVCDRLTSSHSRRAYAGDLAAFVVHMRRQGIHPLDATGDDLRLYKAAMLEAAKSEATIARVLSVLRGTYQQFGKAGLMDWETVRDLQSVESPRVEKNTTPALTEREACKLLHAPDQTTLVGIRDHALLFAFFRTACRCSAIASAKVGHLHRSGTDWYLNVREKGRKRQRKALLEAAPAVLRYVDVAGIAEDRDGPLFRPVTKDLRGFERRQLAVPSIWKIVRKYAVRAGIDAERMGGRGICTHSLRKTAITNAIEHGAKLEQAQALAGHADVRTTQLYFEATGREADEAARHIQIR